MRGDAQIPTRTDDPDPLHGTVGRAVDPDPARDERVQGRQVIHNQRDLATSGSHVADLACPKEALTGAPDPKVRTVELDGDRYDVRLSVLTQGRQSSED